MIQLKNVSKYYYSKGMIASGITKVNLEFDIGEFVVITGESGSGKSTLLNVISGLDTYEEGEMYIEGRETSHYTTAEFEEYRKKYIGNIFQDFNLVNSYTVYQNIELILWINGVNESEIKERIPRILERVGLTEFAKTKVSKLSGGQKQRVAIARALAKDTAVIVADEPTGNLDSESAAEVVKLLSELSKDKLVVIVTHNFDQFEDYATRIVKMNDGRVIEDKYLSRPPEYSMRFESEGGKISNKNKLKLGIRNTFNIIPKFLLLLLVFVFITFSVSAIYTNFKESQTAASEFGFNTFFMNYSDDRIVVKDPDNKEITDEQLQQISEKDRVKYVVKDDILLDKSAYIEDDYLSFYGYAYPAEALEGKPDVGTVPEGKNDAVVQVGKEDGAIMGEESDVIGKKCSLMSEDGETVLARVRISGIKYISDDELTENSRIFLNEGALAAMRANAYCGLSKVKITAGKKKLKSTQEYDSYRILTSKKVKRGTAIVPEEFNEYYKKGKAAGQRISISVKNMYFSGNKLFTVRDVTTEKNYKKLIGKGAYEDHVMDCFINPADFSSLFEGGIYQISVFADNSHEVDGVSNEMIGMGLRTLPLKDAIMEFEDAEGILDIVRIPMLAILVVVIFFIAYFVTRLILKSRDRYFSIVRMLGMSKKNVKRILDIEILTVGTLAFALFVLFGQIVSHDIIQIEYIKYLVEYLTLREYAAIYLVIILMAYLISSRAARKLFTASAMGAYRGEA